MAWAPWRRGLRSGKFNARKHVRDGITFDSKKEAERYIYLKMLKLQGKIKLLTLQPKYELQPKFKKNGKTYRPIIYQADFEYMNQDDNLIVEDVKGFQTREWRMKQKLFEYKYPNLQITVI